MRINTNITAMNTYTQYSKNNSTIAKSVAKLSSGSAINSAADNAAGLAISEKMRAQIRGLDKASSNAQDAISLVQSAEGALGSSTEILQRMRELAIQSSSDTNNDDIDRTALQDEFSQLQSELDEIAKNTTFNKKNLLDGSLASSKTSITDLKLANSSLGVSLGNSASGAYSFNVVVKEETAAVAGSVATAKSSQTATSYNFVDKTSTALQTTAAVEKTSQYNGNYSLSTTVNNDNSITVTASGDNDQSFTATISSDTLAAGVKAGEKIKLEFGDGKTAFSTDLTLKSDYADSANARQALTDDIKNVAISVTGGVDTVDATYAAYGTMTGAEDVKLSVGDTSATFSNGISVSFDKLTTTDLTVDYTDASITYDYAAADVTAAFTASHSVAVGDEAGAITVNATINGAAESLSDQSIVIGNTGTVTIGDYTSTTAVTSMTMADLTPATTDTDARQSAVQTITMRNAAGSEFTIDFQAFEAASGDGDDNIAADAANYTNGTAVIGMTGLTETVNANYSYAVTQANPSVADSTIFDSNGVGTATATFSNLSITSGVDANTVDVSSFSYAGGDWDSGNLEISVVDDQGNEYTATVVGADVTGDASYSQKLNFASTDSSVTFTMDMSVTPSTGTLVAGVDNDLSATPETVATVESTYANETGVLSDELAIKTGVASDGGTKSTTASKFTVKTLANEGLTFQVGANEGDELSINIDRIDAENLGLSSSNITTQESASKAISAVDRAINKVSSQRANLGAIQNRLEYKIDNLSTSSENLTSAESQIRDVDMAKEMTKFTNSNILSQAATAMLAQANSLPQGVLSLIGG